MCYPEKMRIEILIKAVREFKGLLQTWLVQKISMALQNVQNIEYGQAKLISLETLGKLCVALSCQPVFLRHEPQVEEAIAQ